jgi:dipeptidyl aminopeptidase/acylaminoacyl peptidase
MEPGSVLASYNKDGSQRLIIIDVAKSASIDPGFPMNDITFNALKRVSSTTAVIIAATATQPKTLWKLDLPSSESTVLKASASIDVPESVFSLAEGITYPRVYGPGGGIAHAVYLPPTNPDYTAPEGTLPPLIVAVHGGPTWQMGSGLLLRDQYWTSRGYALVQINYVGSTGYGREYVKLLNAQWGVSDIADCASCVDYLAKKGFIDRNRVGITGGSAGGYATLQALCMYPKIYAAGVSEYGISDMQAMFDETHKFESQYLYALCFPPNASDEDKKRITRERSPIYFADNIKAPLLLLQGDADMVVPMNQAEMIEKTIREKGGDVKMIIYPGEGHIFHNGENVKDSVVQAEKWLQKTLLKRVGVNFLAKM